MQYDIRYKKLLLLLAKFKEIQSEFSPTYTYISMNENIKKFIQKINNYDISMNNWPVRYKSSYIYKRELPSFNNPIISIIRYILSYYVAIPLMYPGTYSFLNMLLKKSFVESIIFMRKLNKDIYRCIIETPTNNAIDTFFIDRRSSNHESGNILLIISEGNASFYEIGVFKTVLLETKYSCLGWNTPGFSQSKGIPFYYNIEASILSIVDYAIKNLGFKEENIVLLGWSIGGYPSAIAASKFNSIKCLILDSTFDNIETIAISKFPSLKPIIHFCIRTYFAMYNSKVLEKYSGPIKIIIRSKDHVMIDNLIEFEHHTLKLAFNILKNRYPTIFTDCIMLQLIPIVKNWIQSNKLYKLKDETCDDIPHSLLYSSSFNSDDLSSNKKLILALNILEKYIEIHNTDHGFQIFDSLLNL